MHVEDIHVYSGSSRIFRKGRKGPHEGVSSPHNSRRLFRQEFKSMLINIEKLIEQYIVV